MVPERAAWTTAARNATRPVAAFVAAAAMLLQLVLAAPLEMRMLAASGLTGWPAALCAMRSAGGVPDPARPPISPHDHDNCPVCLGHAAPVGILAGATRLFVASTNWRPWVLAAVATPEPSRPFRLYGSRAPPALA
jgi:hypothetical protein